jgi:hypothetical protein
VHGQRHGDGGVEVRAGDAAGHQHAEHHRDAPADVDREVAAVRIGAQHRLRHDADAERDEHEGAEELGGEFPDEAA